MFLFADAFARSVQTCLSAPDAQPFARGVVLPPGLPLTVVPAFVTFAWSAEFPAGTYTFFAAFTDPGGAGLRALGSASVQFAP